MMTAPLFQLALATAQAIDTAPLWEVAKGVMLTACTALLTWCATALRKVLREQIDQKHILVGVDGKNGIKSDVALLKRRVGAIENRNIAIDAVEEAERQMHPGPNRRHETRRLRDQIHDAHDTAEHPIESDEDSDR